MRHGNPRRSRSGRTNGKRPFNHGPNRSYESNGPGVKLRGTAAQVSDKYLTLARDASSSGDRVAAESFFQYAEHYYRIHATFNAEKKARDAERSAEDSGSDEGLKDTQSTAVPEDETAGEEKAVGGGSSTASVVSVSDSDPVKPKPRRRRSGASGSDSQADPETSL